jgi:thiosulfate dehydrogenase [quinone] large subunit
MPIAVCLIQLALAYEWLVSGLNKLLNPTFSVSLGSMLAFDLHMNHRAWYVALMRRLVLPHADWFAYLVPRAEVWVGGVLLVGALLWCAFPTDRVTAWTAWVVCPALLAAALMNVTYYLLMGDGLPWIDPESAFTEGVELDALLAIPSLVLLGANLSAVRATRRRAG